MAIELLRDQDNGVSLVPDQRGTAASVALLSPQGSTLYTTSATLDSFTATVSAVGATHDILTLSTVTGLQSGRELWLTAAEGWSARVTVSRVAGSVVTLESPPPGLVAVGDTVQGLAFSATIPAAYLTTAGLNYRLLWTISNPAQILPVQAHVVRTKFRDPVTPEDAARLSFAWHKSWAREQTHGQWRALASAATHRVRQQLTSTEDYPHRVGDHSAFVLPGEIALRIELAYLGRVPPGFDSATYATEQERLLRTAVREALGGTWVDRDDDGKVSPKEVQGARNVRIVRV